MSTNARSGRIAKNRLDGYGSASFCDFTSLPALEPEPVIAELSGVNYFSDPTTTISPLPRQEIQLSPNSRSSNSRQSSHADQPDKRHLWTAQTPPHGRILLMAESLGSEAVEIRPDIYRQKVHLVDHASFGCALSPATVRGPLIAKESIVGDGHLRAWLRSGASESVPSEHLLKPGLAAAAPHYASHARGKPLNVFSCGPLRQEAVLVLAFVPGSR